METMFSPAMQMNQCDLRCKRNMKHNGIIATFSALYLFYTSGAPPRKYHTSPSLVGRAECATLRTKWMPLCRAMACLTVSQTRTQHSTVCTDARRRTYLSMIYLFIYLLFRADTALFHSIWYSAGPESARWARNNKRSSFTALRLSCSIRCRKKCNCGLHARGEPLWLLRVPLKYLQI